MTAKDCPLMPSHNEVPKVCSPQVPSYRVGGGSHTRGTRSGPGPSQGGQNAASRAVPFPACSLPLQEVKRTVSMRVNIVSSDLSGELSGCSLGGRNGQPWMAGQETLSLTTRQQHHRPWLPVRLPSPPGWWLLNLVGGRASQVEHKALWWPCVL